MTYQPPTKRILSIDILRGIIMILMALDHTRDFFYHSTFEPTDIEHASTILFFTRWITHYCAPTFIFLSGASAFLSQGRGKTKREAAFQLLTRGIWLLIIEVTIVRFGWLFNLNYSRIIFQVIWAIGCSMIVLSALIFLPRPYILAFALLLIFGHDALDGVKAASLGSYGNLWHILHEQGIITYGNGNTIFVIYPLIPWVGVMAAGYCFGALFRMPEQQRNKWLCGIGSSAIALFILLRAINIYGDPFPWQVQPLWRRSVLSFLNCNKYPPSLLYLLMTLGPGIAFLPVLERMNGAVGRFFTVYGRVPFFYYILHIYLIHIIAVLFEIKQTGSATVNIDIHPSLSLGMVYVVYAIIILLLYFPCRWFMNVKKNNKKWWLSYL